MTVKKIQDMKKKEVQSHEVSATLAPQRYSIFTAPPLQLQIK
jgi:hypothetical protein